MLLPVFTCICVCICKLNENVKSEFITLVIEQEKINYNDQYKDEKIEGETEEKEEKEGNNLNVPQRSDSYKNEKECDRVE